MNRPKPHQNHPNHHRMMNRTIPTLFLLLTLFSNDCFCQKGSTRDFGEPILTDSLSTLFIPVRYSESIFTSNKIAFWGDYYANLVVYNFQTDTYRQLFDKDTYIEAWRNYTHTYSTRTPAKNQNITKAWVFLLVKPTDTNNSGRIDEKDASVLFAISSNGQTLRKLTDEAENVVSFDNFEKQGFILLKIQRDSNNDKSFKSEDEEYYFRKVSLTDLSLGKGIELKSK